MESTPYNDYFIEEVADTNIPAMRLYEKLSFKEYRRKPILEKFAKQNGINYMFSLKYMEK